MNTKMFPELSQQESHSDLIRSAANALVRDVDERLMRLICRRLGVATVEPAELIWRLHRVCRAGAGHEVLMVDGRPFARVYDLGVDGGGGRRTLRQNVEAMEG